MNSTPENPVDQYIEQDETVIWRGRPHGAGTPQGTPLQANNLVRIAIYVVALIAALIVGKPFLSQLEGSMAQTISELPIVPIAVVLAIMFVLPRVLKAFKLDKASRVQRYLDSMGFAITDRRIIVTVRKDALSRTEVLSLGPADLGKLRLREAGEGLHNLLLLKRNNRKGGGAVVRNVSGLDARYAGFKLIEDAEAVQAELENWIAERVAETEQRAASFADGDESAITPIENARLGLKLIAPNDWRIRVRKKAKPFGETFIDKEEWRSPADSDDWNLVSMQNTLGAALQFEVFATEPTVTFEQMTGKLASMPGGGKPLETDENVAFGNLEGFSVTRRQALVTDPASGVLCDAAHLPLITRKYVLHDGHRQVYIETTCPEVCEKTARAIATAIRSISIA